jgi:uncharacterized protein (DUF1697 family)
VPKLVAFLRGMNLGGRRISNADLCAAFGALGFDEVSAFLASGNVVFSATGSPSAITRRVESGLAQQLGYVVPTFLRTAARVRAIAVSRPFSSRGALATRGKLQVIFLAGKTSRKAAASVQALETDDDWLALDGDAIHWSPRGNLSDSALDLKALEKAVGPTTIRTKNTIERLAAKHFGGHAPRPPSDT